MSNGKRSIIVAAGLIILALLTVIIYAKTVPFSRALQQEAANSAEIHRQNAEHRIKWICTSSKADPLCAEQTRQTQRENERQEYDLAAQRMSAWWAQVMGVATLISIVLSLGGISLVLWQIFLTRKAVADTSEATRAMHDANKIAREQAQFARLSARPEISLDVRLFRDIADWMHNPFHLWLKVTNAKPKNDLKYLYINVSFSCSYLGILNTKMISPHISGNLGEFHFNPEVEISDNLEDLEGVEAEVKIWIAYRCQDGFVYEDRLALCGKFEKRQEPMMVVNDLNFAQPLRPHNDPRP